MASTDKGLLDKPYVLFSASLKKTEFNTTKFVQLLVLVKIIYDYTMQLNCLNLLFRQYELLIRMYEGNDPLQPRYEYVGWLEPVSYTHLRNSNMIFGEKK